jgi:hypothetical protein
MVDISLNSYKFWCIIIFFFGIPLRQFAIKNHSVLRTITSHATFLLDINAEDRDGIMDGLEVDALGFKSEWNGRSSKHIPFDWNGP